MIYIAIGALFLSLLIFLFGILKMARGQEKVISKLDAYDEELILINEIKNKPSEKKGPIQRIAKLLERMPTNENRRKTKALMIKQADMPVTFEELFVIKVMATSSLGLLTLAISRNPVYVAMSVLLVWMMPSLMISSRKKKKIKMFDEQLNEGMGMISNALKAGYSFLQALAVAAEETQNPFSQEFKGLLKELSLGIPMEDALNNLVERVPSEDLKLVINAILIQKDVGGNLSEILDNISETIRERQRIKNEVNSLTAQGKLSGIIIMAMPFFLGFIIYLFDNAYILMLFETIIGRALLIFALISQVIGWFFIRKIINIEY
ncbi:type II secretion system F family protein [Fusibacter bizertensis]|uniref:Type II secretion system F family protein n=1 Tax=Fusibacter bizertensis TaxID=1488331 RepID=A0ABT6NA66_9FIRM|nr:type II secretion system F family protein [Fusibacter bizertensis]MDH8677308.1 type II secretion system F family protein [Fusibacter bizertensis]